MPLDFSAADAAAIPVRDAATVMLLRDGDSGLEVFMLRRNLQSDFVGGAYVFPGGAVDPDDSATRIEALSQGRSDAEVSPLLGVDAGGLAYWVAAIRESFEEAGFLLAYDGNGDFVALDDPNNESRFKHHRADVDEGRLGLVELCEQEQLRLAVDRMQYFSRWITPLGAPRRYDTRFFVARAPEGQTPVHDERETIADLWIRPQDALEQHEAGDFELIFPTMRSLEALGRFDTALDVVEHAAAVERVEPVLPTIRESDDGLRIVLPGDEEYDAATNRRVGG
jgi:8-oxo-dGTP pyrophosphatase MutT (NUDIX family)